MLFKTDRCGLAVGCAALMALTGMQARAQDRGQPPRDTRTAEARFDEVGYADIAPTLSGVSAAHKSLPVASYVEVTSLSTGKTIVVGITGRGEPSDGRAIALSCDAFRALALPDGILAPVRVRPVVPTEVEQGALRAGRSAGSRLPAPEPLLVVLRKKLPVAPAGKRIGESCGAAKDTGMSEHQAPALPAPPNAKAAPVKPAKPIPPPKPRPAPPGSDDASPLAKPHWDRDFIVEHEKQPQPPPHHLIRPNPEAPKATGHIFLQVAALSSRSRADVVARSVGGYVEPTGKLFRVRKGPYPNSAAAKAALSAVRAKGFADTRMVN